MSWRVVGTAVAGTSHVERGVMCEDATAWSLAGGRLVVVIADGCGSASRAAEGAALSVRTALEACARQLEAGAPVDAAAWDALLLALFEETRRALLELAGDTPDEVATTLIVAIATGGTLAVGHLGDGAVVVERDGEIETLSPGRHGEFVNQTYFLTDGDALEQVERFVSSDEGIGGVVVLTDGLQSMAFDGAAVEARAGFFRPLLAFARSADAEAFQLERFLRSEAVCDRTDDDKTAVIAVRG